MNAYTESPGVHSPTVSPMVVGVHGVLPVDADGRIGSVDAGLHRLLGYRTGELVGGAGGSWSIPADPLEACDRGSLPARRRRRVLADVASLLSPCGRFAAGETHPRLAPGARRADQTDQQPRQRVKRTAFRFRRFEHYRIRALLYAG